MRSPVNGRGAAWVAGVAMLLELCVCSGLSMTEDTPTSVSIRYDGVVHTLEDATVAANATCAKYGKTAKLRDTQAKAAFERFAHFDCVSG